MLEPVPLLIAIEQLAHHDDDRMEHLLRIGVVGMDDPPLTAEVESDFYEWPRIKEVVTDGGIDLPERLRNAFIFKCFEAIHPALDGTDIAQWPIPNATRWIETQFLTAEADLLLTELRRHVTPGLVIDWNHCSAFPQMPYPFKKGQSHE